MPRLVFVELMQMQGPESCFGVCEADADLTARAPFGVCGADADSRARASFGVCGMDADFRARAGLGFVEWMQMESQSRSVSAPLCDVF